MPRSKRLVDADLYGHAVEYKAQRAAEAAGKTLAEAERDLICAELKARNTTEVTVGGVRIKMTDTRSELSLERAVKTLSRAVLRRVTRPGIVVALWNGERATGRITKEDEKQCRVDQPVTPSIRVDIVGEQQLAA